MTRFLIVFALFLFILWWLRRMLARVTGRARSHRHHDTIEASYTVVDEKKDTDKVP